MNRRKTVLGVISALIVTAGIVTAGSVFYAGPLFQPGSVVSPISMTLPADERGYWNATSSSASPFQYEVGVPKTWHFTLTVAPGGPATFEFYYDGSDYGLHEVDVNATVSCTGATCALLPRFGAYAWSWLVSGYTTGTPFSLDLSLRFLRAFPAVSQSVYASD